MSNRTRSWRKFDYSYGITLSASQFETAFGDYEPETKSRGCTRQWWFEKVHRLPKPAFKPHLLGEVLHEACERYFERRDDLWPDGWDSALDFADSGLVQCLVEDAIENQVLLRSGQDQIEAAIQVQILPDKAASLIGYVDLLRRNEIQDHKTIKDKKWAKSEEDLKRNIQLLLYACALLKMHPPVTHVILRHNYFVKDPREPHTFKVETTVSREYCDNFWNNFIVPSTRELLDLKRARVPLENWRTIPAAERETTCKKRYGGCVFDEICNGPTTPKEYVEKIEKENAEL